jgi:hypothetical protein
MKRTCAVGAVVLGIACALFLFLRQRQSSVPAMAPQTSPPVERIEADALGRSNVTFQQRVALMRPTYSRSNSASAPATNLLTRLLKGDGEPPRVSRAQADAFASANGRRAEALLAAWRASGDASFLREAMEKFPNDPRVAYMAWCKGGAADTPEDSAKAKAEWLEKFKQAAPNNAIANYLSARARMKAGDLDGALEELSAAHDKPWRDYTLDAMQNTEEAYRSAGYSDAESKAIATWGALLPHLAELRGLGKGLDELAASRRQAGDSASADAAAQWALQLGKRTQEEGTLTLIQQLVGVTIQKDVLKNLDANATLGESGQTVQQRLADLDQQRETIRGVAREYNEVVPRLSESDVSSYFDRLKLFGESAALQWAKARVRQN